MSYKLAIITPEGKVFDDAVDELVASGQSGSFGVLQHHAPMLAGLKNGILKLKAQGQESLWMTSQGVLEISKSGEVLILVDKADKQ